MTFFYWPFALLCAITLYFFRRSIDVEFASQILTASSSIIAVVICSVLPVSGHTLLMCNTVIVQIIGLVIQKLKVVAGKMENQPSIVFLGCSESPTAEYVAVCRYLFSESKGKLSDISAQSYFCILTLQTELGVCVIGSDKTITIYKDAFKFTFDDKRVKFAHAKGCMSHKQLLQKLDEIVKKWFTSIDTAGVTNANRYTLCIRESEMCEYYQRTRKNTVYSDCLKLWPRARILSVMKGDYGQVDRFSCVGLLPPIEYNFTPDITIKLTMHETSEGKCIIATSSEPDVLPEFVKKLALQKPKLETTIKNIRFITKKNIGEKNDNDTITKISGWSQFETDSCKQLYQFFWTNVVQTQVIDCIDRVFAQQNKRNRFGITLRENFVLQGQPGTGKTNLINFIAMYLSKKYEMNVTVAHLDSQSFSSEHRFVDIVSNLNEACKSEKQKCLVVLIDEVDKLPFFKLVNSETESRETRTAHENFVEFLKWIEGSNQTTNRFLFATANDVTSLRIIDAKFDGALMRPGRLDRSIHVGGVDSKQWGEFCECMFDTQSLKDNEKFNQIASLCDETCHQEISPLTVKQLETTICNCDFEFSEFLEQVLAKFQS